MVTVPGMPVMGKPEPMGIWSARRMSFSATRRPTCDSCLRRRGRVIGRVRRTRTNAGREVEDDWRFTKICIRREGSWLVVAWEAAP